MDKLAEYQSSEEDSSEGLYESDDDNYVTTSVQTKNKHRTCSSMDLSSVNSSYSVKDVRIEPPDAESTSDTIPEEGEIVSKPTSVVKAPDVRKGKLKRRGLAIVAFSAYMRTCVDPLVDDVIPFEKITMNYGRGYKRHSSTFVCPRSGTYLITWRVVLLEGRETTLNLMVNGTVKKRTTFDCTDGSDNKKCEREEIIKLSVRDRVCITLYDGDSKLLRPTKCKFAGIRLMR